MTCKRFKTGLLALFSVFVVGLFGGGINATHAQDSDGKLEQIQKASKVRVGMGAIPAVRFQEPEHEQARGSRSRDGGAARERAWCRA